MTASGTRSPTASLSSQSLRRTARCRSPGPISRWCGCAQVAPRKVKASARGVGTSKMRLLVANRRKQAHTVTGTAKASSPAMEPVEPGADDAVLWMVAAMGGEHDVHVEQENRQRRRSRRRPSSKASCSDRFDARSIASSASGPVRRAGPSAGGGSRRGLRMLSAGSLGRCSARASGSWDARSDPPPEPPGESPESG